MSLIGWNCRGLGNLQLVKALEKVVSNERSHYSFPYEDKIE